MRALTEPLGTPSFCALRQWGLIPRLAAIEILPLILMTLL
jgi:hypothetical protein